MLEVLIVTTAPEADAVTLMLLIALLILVAKFEAIFAKESPDPTV